MNKKLILKYVLMYLPFVVGIGMFGTGLVNIFSSLLLFLGGYVAIKNTFDYRKIRKNINSIEVKTESKNIETMEDKIDSSKETYIKPTNLDNVTGIKRTRIYKRVRRKW